MLDSAGSIAPQPCRHFALAFDVPFRRIEHGEAHVPAQCAALVARDPEVQLIAEQVSESRGLEMVEGRQEE